MKRTLFLAAAGLCLAGVAHAQSVSKKYDWDNANSQNCMEPYAPAVPKPEDTSLKELIEEVKPEVQTFIEESNRYLDCLSIQMARAKEERDQEKIKTLVKAHNDNVQYQQSVAAEFNATLQALKQQAGQAVGQTGASEPGGEGSPAQPEGEGTAETAKAADSGKDGNEANEKKPEN